jgi:polyisoprenoid-binding protein YceI
MLGNPDYSPPPDMRTPSGRLLLKAPKPDASTLGIIDRVDTAKMTVLPERNQKAVQSTMQKSVLGSAKFAEIRFESTSIRQVGEGRWTVIGNLTLHGETHSITIDVRNEGGAYVGESRIRQTQFGIHPVSVAGGQ